MNDSIYPIISPNVSLSVLRKNVSLLTNVKTFKTKVLNEYQYFIISKCTGDNTIEEISYQVSNNTDVKIKQENVIRFISKMVELGYLHWSPVKIELDQLAPKNKYFQGKNYFNPTALHTVTISVTESCCMKCAHCSQSAPLGKGREFEYDHIIKIITEAYELGARYLGIFGGEPLLYPHLEKIIYYAYETGYRDVIIFTKGTLINYEKAKKLRKVGIKEIQVSCDSHIPELYDKIVAHNGAFEDFYKGLYCLMSVGIDIMLKVVVTKMNISTMPELIEYFCKLNVNHIDLEVVVPVGRADYNLIPDTEQIYELDNYISKLKNNNYFKYKNLSFTYVEYGKPKSCSGGIASVMIFPDGTVGPCDKWYSYRKYFNFGNVYKTTLTDIWHNGIYNRFRNLVDNSTCSKCSHLLYCRGGCMLNNMVMGRDIDDPDYACSKISGKDSGILCVD